MKKGKTSKDKDLKPIEYVYMNHYKTYDLKKINLSK